MQFLLIGSLLFVSAVLAEAIRSKREGTPFHPWGE